MSSSKNVQVVKAPKAVKLSNQAKVHSIFRAVAPFTATLGATQFRKAVFAYMMESIKIKASSAPVMYNIALDLAVTEGVCKAFSKKAGFTKIVKEAVPEDVAKEMTSLMDKAHEQVQADAIAKGQVTVQIKEGMTWKVFNKKTKVVTHYATTKKEAYAVRNGNADVSCKALAVA